MEYLHKKLIVWQKSMQLANCIYDVTEKLIHQKKTLAWSIR